MKEEEDSEGKGVELQTDRHELGRALQGKDTHQTFGNIFNLQCGDLGGKRQRNRKYKQQKLVLGLKSGG